MKQKRTLIFLVFVLLGGIVRAQQYDTLSGPDGRIPHWHYSHWYDTIPCYYDDTNMNPYNHSNPGALLLSHWGNGDDAVNIIQAKEEHVEHLSLLEGVAVWQLDYRDVHLGAPVMISPSPRMAEYVYVLKWNSAHDSLLIMDSVRWDTAQAKVLKLPYNRDTALYGFKYCYVYEAYFDKPVYVDSTFLLGGTRNSNRLERGSFFMVPTLYAYISEHISCGRHELGLNYFLYNLADSSVRRRYLNDEWGHFMPIIEYAELDVRPADSTQGTAGPTGLRSKGTDQEIWARGRLGYRFSHWQDSVTDNPRTIHLMSDTSFTAYFEELPLHEVEGLGGDGHGYVAGGGTFVEGETATLEARPYTQDYHFDHWQDSVTDNPRSFVVTQDTTFTAYFAEGREGIGAPDGAMFTLTPNPAHRHASVAVRGNAGEGWLTVTNAAGQEAMRLKVAPDEEGIDLDLKGLPAGAYFVTLVTPQGSHTEKLVVE